MDCASKRITQGHRILNPKQVWREIFVYSFPTFSYPLETPRNTAPERCVHRVKTYPIELQRAPSQLYLLKINTLNHIKWKVPLGVSRLLVSILNKDER